MITTANIEICGTNPTQTITTYFPHARISFESDCFNFYISNMCRVTKVNN